MDDIESILTLTKALHTFNVTELLNFTVQSPLLRICLYGDGLKGGPKIP